MFAFQAPGVDANDLHGDQVEFSSGGRDEEGQSIEHQVCTYLPTTGLATPNVLVAFQAPGVDANNLHGDQAREYMESEPAVEEEEISQPAVEEVDQGSWKAKASAIVSRHLKAVRLEAEERRRKEEEDEEERQSCKRKRKRGTKRTREFAYQREEPTDPDELKKYKRQVNAKNNRDKKNERMAALEEENAALTMEVEARDRALLEVVRRLNSGSSGDGIAGRAAGIGGVMKRKAILGRPDLVKGRRGRNEVDSRL